MVVLLAVVVVLLAVGGGVTGGGGGVTGGGGGVTGGGGGRRLLLNVVTAGGCRRVAVAGGVGRRVRCNLESVVRAGRDCQRPGLAGDHLDERPPPPRR